MARITYQGKPITFQESLHLCGCPGCQADIIERAKSEPHRRPEFLAYLAGQYPNTAHLEARATPSDQEASDV